MRRITAFLSLAVGAAVAIRLLKRRGGGEEDLHVAARGPREDAGAPPSDEPATTSVDQEYACDGCGTEYRFSGEGRHRVYWRSDASISDPVLDGACVECGKALPGHHPSEEEPAADAEDGTETEAKVEEPESETAEHESKTEEPESETEEPAREA